MRNKITGVTCIITASILLLGFGLSTPGNIWTEEHLRNLHLPLADSNIKIEPVSPEYYYRLPENKPWKTYSVYMPGREPNDYYEWLKQQEPQLAFDENALKNDGDWLRAGESVFDMPVVQLPLDEDFLRALPFIAKDWKAMGLPAAKDGTIPFFKIVVKEKGKLEWGLLSCGMCHTKVMEDGSIIKGAQGNYRFTADIPGSMIGYRPSEDFTKDTVPENVRAFIRSLYEAPWSKSYNQQLLSKFDDEKVIGDLKSAVAGVIHRHGGAIGAPVVIPDLFNLKERKYLDRTGLIRHRDSVDLMLYAALNNQLDLLNSYGDYIPGNRPENPGSGIYTRYSDRQLMSLAKYLYTLKAPANPKPAGKQEIAKGWMIFYSEGCDNCHTPPAYTSNKLLAADGLSYRSIEIDPNDIIDERIGTDPTLALETRRGTGYYKIPSLKGVWNRSALLHGGYVTSLEEMFDSARLTPGYIPKGYKPYWQKTFVVKGHKFGLDLDAEDKQNLVAFLKSL